MRKPAKIEKITYKVVGSPEESQRILGQAYNRIFTIALKNIREKKKDELAKRQPQGGNKKDL